MKVIEHSRWALAFVLPLVVSTGNAAGITDLSLPAFMDVDERITIKKFGAGDDAYWQLKGLGNTTSFLVADGDDSDSIGLDDGLVSYQANFNSAGKLITQAGDKKLSNSLLIYGSLPAGTHGGTSWDDQPEQVLLKADLLDTKPANGKPDLIGTFGGIALGFNTYFTGGWAAENHGLTGGSTGESLWLFGLSNGFNTLIRALDGNDKNGTLDSLIGSSKTIDGVVSVASVPLPQAVWLFSAGLMTLLASRRKHAGSSRFGV